MMFENYYAKLAIIFDITSVHENPLTILRNINK